MDPLIERPRSEGLLPEFQEITVNRAMFKDATYNLRADVLYEILTCLCLDSLGEIKLASKNFYNAAVGLWNAGWRIHCGNHFPLSMELIDRIDINWFKLFRTLNSLKAKVPNMPTPTEEEINKKLESFHIKNDPKHKFFNQGLYLFIVSNYPQLREETNCERIENFDEFKRVQKVRNQARHTEFEALKCIKLAVMQNVPEAIMILKEYNKME